MAGLFIVLIYAGGFMLLLCLGILFYLIFTPSAFIMRIARRDAMARERDDSAESYRVPSTKRSRESMERPF